MAYNNIIAINHLITPRMNTVIQANTANTVLFQAAIQSHQINAAFQPNLENIKNAVSPFHIKAVLPGAKFEWDIRDHYKIADDEIMQVLDGLCREIRDADLSAMTDIEKYNWIENRFTDTFGEDFLMAYALEICTETYQPCPYREIGNMFYAVMNSKLEPEPGGNAAYSVNRKRLYAGMSDKEIQDAIRAKYPRMNLSNRDLFLMLFEMRAAGAEGKVSQLEYMNAVVNPLSVDDKDHLKPGSEQWNDRWLKSINNRADISILTGLWNIAEIQRRWNNESVHPNAADEREFLIRIFGGIFGYNDGLFESAYFEAYKKKYWTEPLPERKLGSQMPDLLGKLIEDLKEHDEELEEYSNNRPESGEPAAAPSSSAETSSW